MSDPAGWEDAIALVEDMLEAAARLLDGDATAPLPELRALDLGPAPHPATRDRLDALLADMDEAMSALERQMEDVTSALAQAGKLRSAGREYLRF